MASMCPLDVSGGSGEVRDVPLVHLLGGDRYRLVVWAQRLHPVVEGAGVVWLQRLDSVDVESGGFAMAGDLDRVRDR